ncbi:MAG: prophage tail fiber N-terminal domain-containing protein [Yersinia sp. (in: enterobacteria)]
MSIIVAGILINPVGEPVSNAQITLTAVDNSFTVLTGFAVTVKTDQAGAYRMLLEEGTYSITIAVNGHSSLYGAVTLDGTTEPSTLNQLLKQQIMESELTPDVIVYFRQIQQQVANALQHASAEKNAAKGFRDEAEVFALQAKGKLARIAASRNSFIYLYPGGTEKHPPRLRVAQRIILDNPFPGRKIAFRCEVQDRKMGVWGAASYFAGVDFSTGALAIPQGDKILIWTGDSSVIYATKHIPNSFHDTSVVAAREYIRQYSAVYRVAVWSID